MADHATILARLKGLTGPDREVDNLISEYLHIVPIRWQEPTGHLDWTPFGEWSLTGSIDAALALVEKVLPRDLEIKLTLPRGFTTSTLRPECELEGDIMQPDRYWSGDSKTLPLAILVALFTYLSAASPALATASEEK